MLVLVTTLPPPVFTLQPPATAAALLLHPATHQKRDVFVHTSIHQCCNSHILTNFPDLGNLKSQGALHSSVAHSGPSVCRMQVSKWTQDVWLPDGWGAGEVSLTVPSYHDQCQRWRGGAASCCLSTRRGNQESYHQLHALSPALSPHCTLSPLATF